MMMKNSIKYIWTLVAASMALTSCSNFEDTDALPAEAQGTRVQFQANVVGEDNSRANITVDGSTFSGKWENLDSMGVLVTAPNVNGAVLKKFTYTGTSFDGTLPSATKGAWKYLAVYPHTAVAGTTAAVPFGNLRTQNGNHYNSNYDALVADALTYTNADPGKTDDGKMVAFNLNRLTSILQFDIKTGSLTDKVKSLVLTSKTQKISASTLDFDIALGKGAKATLNAADQANVIAMNYATGSAPAANNIEAYFNILAGNYDELTLDVITENNQMGSMTFSRNDTNKPFVAGKLHSYKKTSALNFSPVVAPSLSWAGRDMNATHEILVIFDEWGQPISSDYPIDIQIAIPAGLAGLEVNITSAALNPIGVTKLDLFNEKAIPNLGIPYEALGLGCSTQIQYTKAVPFNLTALIPLITSFTETAAGDHIFTVKVTDLAGNVTTQALKFHYTDPKPIFNNDVNLWTNTATWKIGPQASSATFEFQYKRSTDATWQKATLAKQADNTYIATAAPTWVSSTNTAGKTIKTVNPATGIFAGNTYDYQLVVNGTIVDMKKQFTTVVGDKIENGDMYNWTTGPYAIPNASGSSFWGNGNNKNSETLCTRTEEKFGKALPAAKLANTTALDLVLAAGNLFTGSFVLDVTLGTATFGQKYTYNARPTALKVKYHATVGNVTHARTNPGNLKKGNPDKARIFVAIVDWSAQHNVESNGLYGGKTKGAWDPESGTDAVSEGKILGYGSLWITQSTTAAELQDALLDIHWYDTAAPAPKGNYTIVISCAASAYGDFFTGCNTNVMYVDDFEWVY